VLIGGRRGGGRTARPLNEYDTAAIVHAPAANVWRILTDAAGYEKWNPEIVGVEGRFDRGERIRVRVKLGDGAIRSLTLRVTSFTAPSSMEWTGGLPFGLFVGRRIMTVVPRGEDTEFRMHLSMTGPLAAAILRSVGDRQPEIDSFSAALKKYAEGQGRSGG